MLISRGNSKLGTLPSFALPVMVTCPGKTPFCDRYCYGLKGWFALESIKEVNDRRLDATLRKDFVTVIVKEVRRTRAPAFRLHVVGDFYSNDYVDKWIEVAKRLPNVVFFGATRSWRCDFLSKALKVFRDLPNVYLKASVDRTDKLSPFTCGWRVWSVGGIGIPCPHDYGQADNCLACQLCWTIKDFDMKLKLRWGHKHLYMTPSPLF